MSSWWAKDDTRDPKKSSKDEGLKNNNKTKQGHKNKNTLEHRVTHPTQSSRARGGAIDLAGNRATQQRTDIITQ